VPDATEFDRATAVRATGDGVYEAAVDERWNVMRGPHGGYIAAMLLRALTDAVGDEARVPRSLTVYYPAAPKHGPVTIRCQVERAGRSMTTVSARLEQDGKAAALAVAAFSAEWPRTVEFDDTQRPEVPEPEAIEPLDRGGRVPPFTRYFDFRPAVGERWFSGAERALSGGWMRLNDDHALDGPLVAALADAWPPAIFPVATDFVAAPTIELTVHFRAALPVAGDWVLGLFESKVGRDGFFEEDGTLWTRSGDLIAQSRQLALAIDMGAAS
jgi:acyl-CoA thioesterase